MNEVFNVVGIVAVAFTAELVNVMLGMMEERQERANEEKARQIMEEYEGYTEGV